jgi:chromosome segregation ATPase
MDIESLTRQKNELLSEKVNSQIILGEKETTIKNLYHTIEENDKHMKLALEEKNELMEKLKGEAQSPSDETGVKDNAMHELNETILKKNTEIEQLYAQAYEQSKQIQELDSSLKEKEQQIESKNQSIQNIDSSVIEKDQKIKELMTQLEQFGTGEAQLEEITVKLHEKDEKIKELEGQIQYLENDTVQKSKFDKVQLLIEKKDEIITEKEKEIFELNNSIQTSIQKVNNLQQQMETFSLLKKDVGKKEERIKTLVSEIEDLRQKNLSGSDLARHFEERLEESHKSIAKYEIALESLKEKESEIERLQKKDDAVKNKFREAEQIEDRLLTDLQNVKDEKLKGEAELERKDAEIIELKKKIKLMRRDLSQS